MPSGTAVSTSRSYKSFFRHICILCSPIKSNLCLTILFFGGIYAAVFFSADKIVKMETDRFCVKKVEFDGNDHVPEILLLKKSGVKYKTNILLQSIADIKRRLEGISWIKSAVVQRKFPDKICIRVAERIPIAILQSKYKLYLVDSEGVVLEHDGIGDFSNLPIVVGEGAEKEAAQLLKFLDKFPKIRKQLVFAVRIGRRRWNIKINRGITVKLPERGVIQALGILDEISDNNGFFFDDIVSIDLRLLDRIIVNRKNKITEEKIAG